MLGRHNFERPGDLYSSPQLTQFSQNDVSNSQVDCKVPATPKCNSRLKSFDQNVPSTPFTKMKTPVLVLPDVNTVLVRETEVSHLTTSLLFSTQNVINYLQTADQLVPTTPDNCRRNNDHNRDISSSPNQGSVFQEKDETKNKNCDKRLNSFKSKLSLSKSKESVNVKSPVSSSIQEEPNSEGINKSPQQFDINIQREYAIRSQTDPSLTTPSNSLSSLSSRAEMTHIRRCLFHVQTSSSPTRSSHDSNTEDVFSGEDIFFV